MGSWELTSRLFHCITTLAVVLPGLAVTVRRLHDTDRSGWWLLILLVPIVGAIVFLVFMATPGGEMAQQVRCKSEGCRGRVIETTASALLYV